MWLFTSVSLQRQAAVLFSLLNGASQSLVATQYSINHKAVERTSQAIDDVKMKYVLSKEQDIVHGGGSIWVDVEAGEIPRQDKDAHLHVALHTRQVACPRRRMPATGRTSYGATSGACAWDCVRKYTHVRNKRHDISH